jgi:hypothetical protein
MIPFAKQFTFLIWGRRFDYDVTTGLGYALQSYNPFTDMCLVRVSQYGALIYHTPMERVEYERLIDQARDRREAQRYGHD